MRHSEEAQEKTAKARPTRARAKEARVEKVAKAAREAKARAAARASKSMGDPLKQRLVSRTQCRLCGEEGHWEEDCLQADVEMPQAKRRETFSRPPVGVGVSQAWCVGNLDGLTVDRECRNSTQVVDVTRNPSTNLMGVMTTSRRTRNFGTVVLRWVALERWQLLVHFRPSPRLEKHFAPQLQTFGVSSLGVMVVRWKRRLL